MGGVDRPYGLRHHPGWGWRGECECYHPAVPNLLRQRDKWLLAHQPASLQFVGRAANYCDQRRCDSPVLQVFLRNIQGGLSDLTAGKAAPVASLVRSFSKADASYALEISYVKTALSTLVKVAKTKDASLIPAIATALTQADAAGFAANSPINSDLDVWSRLCAPWATAMNSTKAVALDLANIADDPGGGLTTLSELQKVIRKQPGSPRVAFVSSIPSTGDLRSATLSVTTSKYRVYTCVSFYSSVPQSAVPSICTHQ
jgi:hypothetical protein